jgi:hypothetical protein
MPAVLVNHSELTAFAVGGEHVIGKPSTMCFQIYAEMSFQLNATFYFGRNVASTRWLHLRFL